MTSQPDALLAIKPVAIKPAQLPHYTHPAVIVGSVIILAIITLMAGVTLAIAHHLVSAEPMTHRDQSPRLPCLEKHEMIGANLNLTEHTARSGPAVDVIPAPVSEMKFISNIRWTESGCGVTLAATGPRADTSAASPPV
ncbi:hypothetical protein [Mycobacterium sp.]|uniref:hypothetical protein n=1 Tax=Mycobacterium sp. TaxID=1785 RepID=UPI002B710B7C|nr:hypothetical protein [Mycobacterium sp.]